MLAGYNQVATNKLLQFKDYFEVISWEVNFSTGKCSKGFVEVVIRQRFNPRLSKQI